MLFLKKTDYLPDDIKRPGKEDKIQELVIPFDYVRADWLPKAIQDTADIRKVGSGISAM